MFFDTFPPGPYATGTRESMFLDKRDMKYLVREANLEYVINEYGYRGSIAPGGDAAFGCSYTVGYFVTEGKQWPSLLGVFNGGILAGSNDTIARLATTYIKQYAPPNVYVMWTYKSRREMVLENGELFNYTRPEKDVPTSQAQFELWNDFETDYNFEKNYNLVNSTAIAHGTKIHSLNVEDISKYDYLPLAPNNDHTSEGWHQAIAKHFLD